MDLLEKYLTSKLAVVTGFSDNEAPAFAACETPEQAEASLPLLLNLVRLDHQNEDRQIEAAKMLELTRRRENMLDTWAALAARFPTNKLALRMQLRWLRRENRILEGRAILGEMTAQDPSIHLAGMWAELGDNRECDNIFARLLDLKPSNTKARVTWVKLLFARGDLAKANAIAAHLRGLPQLSSSAVSIIQKIDAANSVRMKLDHESSSQMNLPSAALYHSILAFRQRQIPPSASPHLGKVSFITGTLGAGGAERQLTRIACAMHALQTAEEPVNGVRLHGAIEMLITNVSSQAANDFFLPQVIRSGIALTTVCELPAEPLSHVGLPDGIVAEVAAVLPKNTLFGVQRLVAHFRREKPEVAYIWQDGAVLMAALAALIAQVPRIVISVRGMPPNMRINLAKDEFLGMYQALAQIPGVAFSSNSRAAADAYCDWIGLPATAFSVIHNAFEPEQAAVEISEASTWQKFSDATANATFTIGGVFRFDPNKRPLLWVQFAAKALHAFPNLRFIIVGSGAVLNQAIKLSEELGIKGRILFVGHSHNVGYWLAKMDILTLLSEFEGLPNVLIEAQLAGLPVISTPAGGATETFVTGRTGLVLNSAKNPDSEDYLTKLAQLISNPARLKFMGHAAREIARQKFAMPAILAQSVRLFKGRDPGATIDSSSVPFPSPLLARG